MAGVTKPYYRSGYVFVTRKGRGLEDINSLADPRLKKLKIGVNLFLNSTPRTPPPGNGAQPIRRRWQSPGIHHLLRRDSIRPEDIINAVAKKDIDVAIVWGPLAGYFVKKVVGATGAHPARGREGLGHRLPVPATTSAWRSRRDKALRDSLQTLLDRRASRDPGAF